MFSSYNNSILILSIYLLVYQFEQDWTDCYAEKMLSKCWVSGKRQTNQMKETLEKGGMADNWNSVETQQKKRKSGY